MSHSLQLGAALAVVALEFTNVFEFLTSPPRPLLPISVFALRFGVIGLGVIGGLLDVNRVTQLTRKPIFRWAFAVCLLFTWGILHRVVDTQADIETYLYIRQFALDITAILFIIACVMLFDDEQVLFAAKYTVCVATLLAIALNLYEAIRPGTFSVVPGRAAGLYRDPNVSGMAIVLGSLISLPTVPRRWREAFLFLAAIAVIATFSREAMLTFGIVLVGALFAREVSLRRLALGATLGIGLLISFHAATLLHTGWTLEADNLSRLSFEVSDPSARGRLELASDAWRQFEKAPIFGQGLGTTVFWTASDNVHSYYLVLLVDEGIVGLLVVPALLLSIRRSSWDYYTFAAVFLVWCLFLHLVMSLPYSLITLAIVASESSIHRRRSEGISRVSCRQVAHALP